MKVYYYPEDRIRMLHAVEGDVYIDSVTGEIYLKLNKWEKQNKYLIEFIKPDYWEEIKKEFKKESSKGKQIDETKILLDITKEALNEHGIKFKEILQGTYIERNVKQHFVIKYFLEVKANEIKD